MKKIFTLTAIMLLIAMFATVFVGCDKKGEEQSADKENDFDKIVSDRITAEEWAALLEKPADEINNFRLYAYEYANYGAAPDSGSVGIKEGECITEVKDGVMHDVVTYLRGGFKDWERLICPDEDNLWRLFSYNAPVTGPQDQWEEWKDEVQQEGVDLLDMNVMPDISYEEFEYSEEHKGYVYEREEGSRYGIMIIKFQDGKVVAYSEKETYDNELVLENRYIFYDFGKVEEIKIPEEVQEMLKKPYDGDIVFPD